LRKVTISFMSVIPHAATALLPLDALSWNLILECFSKISCENFSLIKTDKNNRYFKWKPTCLFDHISLIFSWNEKHFSQKL
jgi:hypothetical protein